MDNPKGKEGIPLVKNRGGGDLLLNPEEKKKKIQEESKELSLFS